MSVQAAPALVAGAVPQPAPLNSATTMPIQLTSAYTVQRPFYLAGQRVEVGATVDLPWPLAAELANAGKVMPVVAVASDLMAGSADPVDPVDPVADPLPPKRTPRRPGPGNSA